VKLIRESGGRADLLADFLVDFLTCLPVRVTDVVVEQGAIPLDDYPGGPRPTSTVTVSGGGRVGRGENVAFKESEHAAFVARARDFLVRAGGMGGGPCGVGAVMSALPPEASRYERAALEAALIDLGLRQAGLGLGDLGGTDEAWLRVVVSFAPGAAPAGRIRRLRAAGYRGEMKVDVDPAWGPETCRELGLRRDEIAILDFKGRGDQRLVRELAGQIPDAIFEDPPPDTGDASEDGPARISRDAPLVNCDAVAGALARGEAVNLKAPRMGGPLQVLRALSLAAAAPAFTQGPRVWAYLGGMFEVGVGRAQARQLAALFCPNGPNDLAPHAGWSAGRAELAEAANAPASAAGRRETWAPSALSIRLDHPGFGAGPVDNPVSTIDV